MRLSTENDSRTQYLSCEVNRAIDIASEVTVGSTLTTRSLTLLVDVYLRVHRCTLLEVHTLYITDVPLATVAIPSPDSAELLSKRINLSPF